MNKITVFKKEHFPNFTRKDKIKEFSEYKNAKKFVLDEFFKNRMDIPNISEKTTESNHLLNEERIKETIITCRDTPTIEYVIVQSGDKDDK